MVCELCSTKCGHLSLIPAVLLFEKKCSILDTSSYFTLFNSVVLADSSIIYVCLSDHFIYENHHDSVP